MSSYLLYIKHQLLQISYAMWTINNIIFGLKFWKKQEPSLEVNFYAVSVRKNQSRYELACILKSGMIFMHGHTLKYQIKEQDGINEQGENFTEI